MFMNLFGGLIIWYLLRIGSPFTDQYDRPWIDCLKFPRVFVGFD